MKLNLSIIFLIFFSIIAVKIKKEDVPAAPAGGPLVPSEKVTSHPAKVDAILDEGLINIF